MINFFWKGAQSVVNILNKVSSWVDEIAPLPNPSRFGNKAFQTFVDKVQEVKKKTDII
jgi:hypothetical protein